METLNINTQIPEKIQERRRFPRYGCSLKVSYATKGIASIKSISEAKNISRGGIGLRITRLVKKGDILVLKISRDENGREVSAKARVQWVETASIHSKLIVDAGLQFTDIKPSEVDELLATVK